MRIFTAIILALIFLMTSCEPLETIESRESRETDCLGFPDEYPVEFREKNICTDESWF